jgi:hypothetical protein
VDRMESIQATPPPGFASPGADDRLREPV